MFIVKNCGWRAGARMDISDGNIFFIVNCYCLLNIATTVAW
jgi:hypothetical protein